MKPIRISLIFAFVCCLTLSAQLVPAQQLDDVATGMGVNPNGTVSTSQSKEAVADVPVTDPDGMVSTSASGEAIASGMEFDPDGKPMASLRGPRKDEPIENPGEKPVLQIM